MRKKLRSKTQQTKAKNKLIIDLLNSTYLMTQALLSREKKKRSPSDKKAKQKKESRPQQTEKLKKKIFYLNEQIRQKTNQYQDMFTQAYNQQSLERPITNIQISQKNLRNSVDFHQNDQNIINDQLFDEDNQYEQISLLNSIVQKQLHDELAQQYQFDQSIQQYSPIDQQQQKDLLNQVQSQIDYDQFLKINSLIQKSESNQFQESQKAQELKDPVKQTKQKTASVSLQKAQELKDSAKVIKQKIPSLSFKKVKELKDPAKEIKQKTASVSPKKTKDVKDSAKQIKQQTPSVLPQKTKELKDSAKEIKQQASSVLPQKVQELKDSVKEIKQKTVSLSPKKAKEAQNSVKDIKQQTPSVLLQKAEELKDSAKEMKEKTPSLSPKQVIQLKDPVHEIKQQTPSVLPQKAKEVNDSAKDIKQQTLSVSPQKAKEPKDLVKDIKQKTVSLSPKKVKDVKDSVLPQKTKDVKDSAKEIKQQTLSVLPQKAEEVKDSAKEIKQKTPSLSPKKQKDVNEAARKIKQQTPSVLPQEVKEVKDSVKEIKQKTVSLSPKKVKDVKDSVLPQKTKDVKDSAKEMKQKTPSLSPKKVIQLKDPVHEIKQQTPLDGKDKPNYQKSQENSFKETQKAEKLALLVQEFKEKSPCHETERLFSKNESLYQNFNSQTKKTEQQQNFVQEIDEGSFYDESDKPNNYKNINQLIEDQNNQGGSRSIGKYQTKRSTTMQFSSQYVIQENLQLQNRILSEQATDFQDDIEEQDQDAYSEDTFLTIQINFLKQIQEKVSILFNESFERQASQNTSEIEISKRNYEAETNRLKQTIQLNDDICIIPESSRGSIADSIKINQYGIINQDQPSHSQSYVTERIIEGIMLDQKQLEEHSILETIKIQNKEQINKETNSFYIIQSVDIELIKMFGEERVQLLNKEINNLLQINQQKNTDDLTQMIKQCLIRIAVKMLGIKLLDQQARSQLTLKDLFKQQDIRILFLKEHNFKIKSNESSKVGLNQNQEIQVIRPQDFIKRINQLLSRQNNRIEQLSKFSQQILSDNTQLDDEYESSLLALFQSKLYSNLIFFSQVEHILGILGVSSSPLIDTERSNEYQAHDIDSIRLKNRVNKLIDSTDSDQQ